MDNDYLLQEGDLLFARSGATAGKTYLHCNDIGASIFAGYCIRFKFDPLKVLPQFVYLYTKTVRYEAWVRSMQRPSGQPNINKEEFKSFTIPLPDISTQERLATRFSEALEKRKAMLDNADSLLAGLDGFVLEQLGLRLPPPDQSPSHAVRLGDVRGDRCDALFYAPRLRKLAATLCSSPLRIESLGKLSPDLAGGATPKRGSDELYATEGVRFLRIMNIAPFEIRLEDVKYVVPEVHTGDLSRSQLRENDILMTITGRVGTTAVVGADVLPANINQHIVRIRLIDDTVLPEYLAAYLNCSFGLMLTNRGVTGGTRIAVDYGTVRGLLVPVPSRKIQIKICAEITRRRNEARQLRTDADRLWIGAKTEFEAALIGAEHSSEENKG